MKTVCVSANIALILKRIVNAVSTLSISNHYYLAHYHAKHEHPQHQKHTTKWNDPFWLAVKKDWPWWSHSHRWKWPRDDLRARLSGYKAHTHSAPSPWLDRKWSWSSLFSIVTQSDLGQTDLPPPNSPLRGPLRSPRSDGPSPRPEMTPNFGEEPHDTIHALLRNPTLYDPVRTPRYPMVLCHGLYGFDSRGPSTFPSLRMHYWANVLQILRKKVGAEVIVTSVPATGSINSRAQALHEQLSTRALGRGVNLLAHSMGGLDCRQLISHVRPTEYAPLSLTSVATPHRGSPFMDWCADNLGIGKLSTPISVSATTEAHSSTPSSTASLLPNTLTSLPSSVTTLLLSLVDSPAYANLTSSYLNNVFNPSTPDDPKVKYFSIAGRMNNVNILHPFWFTKMVLDGFEEKQRALDKKSWEEALERGESWATGSARPHWADEREWGNDGLVTVQSAKWGELLGIMEGCDHWEMRGARGIEFGVDLPALPSFGLGGSDSGPTVNKPGDASNGDRNWASFVGAWRLAEKKFQEIAGNSANSVTPSRSQAGLGPESEPRPISSATLAVVPRPSHAIVTFAPAAAEAEVISSIRAKERERVLDRDRDDAVVKSSTDRLSAVFDWIMQIPIGTNVSPASAFSAMTGSSSSLPPLLSSSTGGGSGSVKRSEPGGISKETERRKRNDLATKEDLERLYVAMARKLYDEGL